MKKRLGNYMQEYAVGLFTILLFVFCMIFLPNFSSAKNLVNISTQISINGLIATGMTFVILTGGIAHSKYVTDVIRDYVSSIAPVYVYPGEHEMESLGEQSYEALIGKAEVFEL